MMAVGDLVVTEQFGGPVKECDGFTRNGLRYWLSLPISSIIVEKQGVANTEFFVLISSSVPILLI